MSLAAGVAMFVVAGVADGAVDVDIVAAALAATAVADGVSDVGV